MLVHIVIEIAIIVYLIQGIIAGRKLGSSLKEKVAELENEQENIPTVQAYQYDKKFARKNGANKGWVIVVAVIGLPIGFFVDFVIIGFLATYYSISTTAILLIFSFILLAIVVSFVWIVIQLRPYTLAKNVQYFMLDEQLYRCCYQDVSTAEVLKECKVIKKNPSEFICQYLDQGKKRKLIIPNGYPHLEDILK